MKVAILLAAYNGVEYIEEQILSILDQRGVELKIFISVDYSVDETYNLCKSFANAYVNICVLPYGDVYGSAARNFFRLISDVKIDDYDFVAFSDQDDIWFLNKISTAVNKISDEKYSCYSSDVLARWDDGKVKLLKKSYPQRKWDYYFESAGPGCTYVFKNNFAVKLRNFIAENELLLRDLGGGQHDWFIYFFARKNNYKWLIDDFSGMYYRQHAGNLVGANYGFSAFFHRLKVVLSGWGFRQACFIANTSGASDGDLIAKNLRRGRLGVINLLFYSGDCRRRLRDRFFFGIACCLVFVFGY